MSIVPLNLYVYALTDSSFNSRISPRDTMSSAPTRAVSQAPPAPPPESLPDMELDLPPSPPPVEQTLAERRAKRQAILAKYSQSSPNPGQGTSSAVTQPPPSVSVSNTASQSHSAAGTPLASAKPSDDVDGKLNILFKSISDQPCIHAGKRESLSPPPSATDETFELAKDDEQEKAQAGAQGQDGTGEQISAADYDPSLDRREDERRRVLKDEPIDVETIEEEEEEEEDVDDMFAIATSEKKKVRKVMKITVGACHASPSSIPLMRFY